MGDLHTNTHLQAAAWVPDDDPERPWDEADLATEWIWERSEAEDVRPLLVTNTLQRARSIDRLEEIARAGGGQDTPQSKERFERGPVLACVPDEQTLKLALNLARGYSPAVVESVRFPLAEWAAGAGAITLLDGSASSLPEEVKTDLDHAMSFGGNNGWTGSREKEHARNHPARHVQAGRLAPEQAASYVMAKGVSDRGAQRLRLLLERVR